MTPPKTNGTASAPLARNDYREGQVLRAADLERESSYFLARARQHAALAHIPGILRGLRLQVFERGTEEAFTEERLANEGAIPLDLYLEAGVAVDGYGRLVSVPRREQLRITLATSPSLLRQGRYRIELLYDRTMQGSGAGGRGTDPCAAIGASTGGGGRTVRERYTLRLVPADQTLDQPVLGTVLDGPPDAPEAKAPVVLGTVDWDGADAFVGFSQQGRVYAGVRAENMLSPDERAEIDLRDRGGRVAVRVAAEPVPGKAPELADAVRVDPDGRVWVRSSVDVGPSGLGFRAHADGGPQTNWYAGLSSFSSGAKYGKTTPDDQGEDEDLAPPAYAPGEQELRVVFERAEVQEGLRRVVIGHVDRGGEEFRPALIVYDRPPGSSKEGASTVEVWGDLVIRGTTYLTGVQRVLPGGGAPGDDELNILLRQLAGPLAGIFRNFLTSDPEWLANFAARVADRLRDEAQMGALATALVNRIAAEETLAQRIADIVVARVQATNATAQTLADAITARLQANTNTATAQALADVIAARVQATDATAQTIADAVAARVQVTNATADIFASRVVARVDDTPALSTQVADIVVDAVESGGGFPPRLTEAIIDALENDPTLSASFKSALGIP